MDEIVRPTLAEMARRGTPYSGVLYVGLMIGGRRAAARGIQCALRRPRGPGADDAPRGPSARRGAGLRGRPDRRSPGGLGRRSCALRGDGGPGLPRSASRPGKVISGLADLARGQAGRWCFTPARRSATGRIIASGGRVLGVTARGRHPRGCSRARLRARRPHRLPGRAGAARYRLAGLVGSLTRPAKGVSPPAL